MRADFARAVVRFLMIGAFGRVSLDVSLAEGH